MELSWEETRKFISKYLLIYFGLALVLFFVLRWYKTANFSQDTLETMLTTVSVLRDKTDDPCKYAILGEPTTAQANYVKVNIYCGRTKSLNSMDLRAIKEKTVGGALTELARINGYTGNRNNWICKLNRKPFVSFEEKLESKATVDCFLGLSEKEIAKYYETI